MIRITIESVPFGDETQKKVIERFDVYNITAKPISDYAVKRYQERFNGGNLGLFVIDEFLVDQHQRTNGVTELARRVLEVADVEREEIASNAILKDEDK